MKMQITSYLLSVKASCSSFLIFLNEKENMIYGKRKKSVKNLVLITLRKHLLLIKSAVVVEQTFASRVDARWILPISDQ